MCKVISKVDANASEGAQLTEGVWVSEDGKTKDCEQPTKKTTPHCNLIGRYFQLYHYYCINVPVVHHAEASLPTPAAFLYHISFFR